MLTKKTQKNSYSNKEINDTIAKMVKNKILLKEALFR